MAGAAIILALGGERTDHHLVELVGRGPQAEEIDRNLEHQQPHHRHPGDRRTHHQRPKAQQDHRRRQARRIEIAKGDAARHRRRGNSGQRGDRPVAAQHAHHAAQPDTRRPQQRQHQIEVGRRPPPAHRLAPAARQHEQADAAQHQLVERPGDEARTAQMNRADQRHRDRVEGAAQEDSERAKQPAEQQRADVFRHVAARLDDPAAETGDGGRIGRRFVSHAASYPSRYDPDATLAPRY